MKIRVNSWFIAVTGLVVFGYFATLFNLQNGVRGEYYAAVVKSMSLSASNFFLGALDPAGTVSLDKIPGSFWVPALFVRLFGFSTWSLEAPNAIATIAASVIIAFAARRVAGQTAGIIAGLVVATTPVLAAVARSNHPESIFILVLSMVALSATKAFSTQKLRHLIWVALWVAVAFDCYMLEAWAVWPALGLAWLLTNKPMGKKVTDVLIAGSISFVASLIWPSVVWLIGASNRPYIGGTLHNNPFEMIFGYNGLGRFGFTAGFSAGQFETYTPEFGGKPGILRLFNSHLAGQIGWLLPSAGIAIVILVVMRRRLNVALYAFFAGWSIVLFAMFSSIAGMHQFYTGALAVSISILIAGAFVEARKAGNRFGQIGLILASGFMAHYVEQYYSHYFHRLGLVQLILSILASLIIFYESKMRANAKSWVSKFLNPTIALAAGLSLFLAPAVWSIDAQNYITDVNPTAGLLAPKFIRGKEVLPKRATDHPLVAAKLAAVEYLTAHSSGYKYAFAALSGISAAPFITHTELSVLPIGGFKGFDLYPTLQNFKAMVHSREVRYLLMLHSEYNRVGAGRATSIDTPDFKRIENWVMADCAIVKYLPLALHQNDSPRIYDCSMVR